MGEIAVGHGSLRPEMGTVHPMSEDLALDREDRAGHTVLKARGFLDISTCGRLRDALSDLITAEVPVVILDLSQIDFIDSSALGVILGSWKLMHAQDGVLTVVTTAPHITKLFEITALTLTIGLYPSVAEARAALGLAAVEA